MGVSLLHRNRTLVNIRIGKRSGATVQSSDWYSPVAVVITTIGLCALLVWQIFFNTTWFNDKLRLDKDVDEEKIDMYIPRTTILAVMSMVIGGLVLVDNVPQLATQILAFMQEKELFRRDPESKYIIDRGVRTLFGALLLTQAKRVAAFIEKQNFCVRSEGPQCFR